MPSASPTTDCILAVYSFNYWAPTHSSPCSLSNPTPPHTSHPPLFSFDVSPRHSMTVGPTQMCTYSICQMVDRSPISALGTTFPPATLP